MIRAIFSFKSLRLLSSQKTEPFSLSSTFGLKSLFLWKILVVLVFKKGGRAPKGMDFQIENPRCGLDLRVGTFFEEIGQSLL